MDAAGAAAEQAELLAVVPLETWCVSDSLLLEEILEATQGGFGHPRVEALLSRLRKQASSTPAGAVRLASTLLRDTGIVETHRLAISLLEEVLDWRAVPSESRRELAGLLAPLAATTVSGTETSMGDRLSTSDGARSTAEQRWSESPDDALWRARAAQLRRLMVAQPSASASVGVSTTALASGGEQRLVASSRRSASAPSLPPAALALSASTSRLATAPGRSTSGAGGAASRGGLPPALVALTESFFRGEPALLPRKENRQDRDTVALTGLPKPLSRDAVTPMIASAWWNARQRPFYQGQPIFPGQQFKIPTLVDRSDGRPYFKEYHRCKASRF
eukprot:TRINITY_DN37269_c0_g1_i1.p1 TRINITY_DN37269_c0_g1~~TRINITY_DN37269_c0_g1_i1.p1  ORF type:complete len:334 (-),score=67.19 TRINITY_DN37269_c0_g1_i1:143-1144(-)